MRTVFQKYNCIRVWDTKSLLYLLQTNIAYLFMCIYTGHRMGALREVTKCDHSLKMGGENTQVHYSCKFLNELCSNHRQSLNLASQHSWDHSLHCVHRVEALSSRRVWFELNLAKHCLVALVVAVSLLSNIIGMCCGVLFAILLVNIS